MRVVRTPVVVAIVAVAIASVALQSAGIAPVLMGGAGCSPGKADKGFVRKMNAERADEGIAKLTMDEDLVRVAKKHTKEMLAKGTLAHTSPDVLGKRVTNWSELGENIGAGQTVASLHKAFMDSPTHRDNILYSKFRYVGVGARRDGDGKLWVTVVFEATADPGTTVKGC